MTNKEALNVILPSFIKINQCTCSPEGYKDLGAYIDYVHDKGWISPAEKTQLLYYLQEISH